MMENRDYSQSVIYFIRHKTNNTLPFYIGGTNDFNYRQENHSSKCKNIKDRDYNLKVYKYIGENGGWDEWEMIIYEQYPLYLDTNKDNERALDMREQYWIDYYDNINNGLNGARAYLSEEVKKEQSRISNKKRLENMTEEEKKEKREYDRLCYAIRTEEQIKKDQEREKRRNERIRNDKELLQKKRKQSRESASKPWICIICNITINRGGRCRHLKTQSHLNKAANVANIE